MVQKSLIIPDRKRKLKPPFAWIDRMFLLNGFWEVLTPYEILLYLFLILVADRDGLSFYSYDKICQYLKVDVDTYIQSRNGLIDKQLIAYENSVFQVLSLPQRQKKTQTKQQRPSVSKPKQADFQAIADVFSQLAQHGANF
jgi:hypothetical protein